MDSILAWFGLIVVGYVFWWWNELWYVVPLMMRARNSPASSSTAKLPPGTMGFPFVGEMISFLWYYKFLRRPDDYINAKRRKYGDGGGMFRTHLFGSPTIIIYGPAPNKFVLSSEERFMQEWPSVELLGTTSIAATHGKAHARVRNFVISVMHRPEALRRVAALVQPRIVTVLESWAKMGKFQARYEVRKLSFEHIAKLFMGKEPGPFILSLDKLYEGLLPGVRAYPINFPGFAYHHALQCRKKLEDIFLIELEKRKNYQLNKVEANGDLMDGLMQMEDAKGDRLSDKEVVDNIVSLVVGGYMTTSLVSTWAIYLLAKHPNVLIKLREENMAMKKGSPGDFITTDDISNLKYTNKVVDEVIRVANVSAFVFRRVVKEVDYKGYKIPNGWSVIAFLRYIHTNPENFEDPMYFNPERWNEPPKPGTNQVFGAGQRLCPGNNLAKIQLALLLHHLSIGYKWKLVNPNADIIYLSHPAPADGVELHGTMEAWTQMSAYEGDRQHWIVFDTLTNFKVDGGGTFNGNGKNWWQKSCKTNNSLPCNNEPRPTAVTFYHCNNLRVKNLRFKDAQQMHVTFQECFDVDVSNLVIKAPGDSPNTDGIHVAETQNIVIRNSVIGTGDDCISIVSGSRNVRATDITCGPGHGISIGSLGADNSEAEVSNVMVNGATLRGTTNGVRIKTWQGGSGYAKNIKFLNIKMQNVTNPIIIDQNYCDQAEPCQEQDSSVKLSNVLYQNIIGTSASEVAIKFDCSRTVPCRGIYLQDVILEPEGRGDTTASCENVRYVNRGKFFPRCSP